MLNKLKKYKINFLKNYYKKSDCNDEADLSLLKAGEQIKNSAFKSSSFDPDFKERLKAQILEKRQEKKLSMKEKFLLLWKDFKGLFTFDFTMKRLVPIVAGVTLVAVLAVTLNLSVFISGILHPTEKDLPFARFFVDIAYAHENFEATATDDTVTGVAKETSFKIISKTPIIDENTLTQSIYFEPQTDFTLEKISDTEFLVKPKTILEDGELYKLLIGSAYLDENGLQVDYDYSWAFQVKNTFKIIGTLPAHQANDVPVTSGIEVTFSTDKFIGFEEAFSITPAVKGKFEKHGRVMVFVPEKLEEQTVYTVIIRPNVSVVDSDEKLSKETFFQFATEKLSATIQNTDNFRFFDFSMEFGTEIAPVFSVYTNNPQNIEVPVTVYAFKDAGEYLAEMKKYEVIPYWAYNIKMSSELNLSKLKKIAEYKIKISEDGYNYFLSLPNPLPAGNYVVVAKDGKKYDAKIFTQITDVAAYYNLTNNKLLFWVNDIKTKAPLSGVMVKDVATGLSAQTDKDGVVTFDVLQSDIYKSEIKQFLLSSGDRYLAMPVNYYTGNSLSYLDRYWLYFYTDRAKYQPTDEINFWGVIKSRGQDEAVKNVTVSLISGNMYDYNQEPLVLTKQKLSVDDHGNYIGKLALKNLVPSGYRLVVKDGEQVISEKYVSVETYIKPSYKLEIKPSRSRIYAGEKDEYTIKTTFFDGTPVANIELGYNYYDQNGSLKTDENGMSYLSFDTVYSDEKFSYYGYETHALEVSANKTETGDIRENTTVTVYGPNMDFVKTEIKGSDKQANISTQVLSRDLNNEKTDYFGQPVVNLPVVAEITEITYVAKETGTRYDFINKVSYKTYDYSEKENRLADINLKTDANGYISASFNTIAEKSYRVRLVSTAENGRIFDSGTLYYYATKNIQYDSAYENYFLKEKDATLHTNGYKVGETAEFDFSLNDNPIESGKGGTFLYFLLQKGLLNYEVNNNSYFNVKFNEQHIPNISLGGVWFDGKSFHIANNQSIRFDKNEKKLSLEVTTDKAKYVPGEEVTLKVKVKNKEGKAVTADVNLDLVDEAFATLGKTTADPLNEFYYNISAGMIDSGFSHRLPTLNGGAERGGCFLAGTKIKMADGSEKNIENIRSGDKILTFTDELNHSLISGEVTKTYEHLVAKYLIINDRLFVTPEHRIFVNDTWRTIGEAKLGDFLMDEAGLPVKIKKIEERHEFVKVYNFEVTPEHTYLANGIYVHNDKDGDRQYFPDIALFKNIRTNKKGEASVTFTLPDNITSWIITTQAFSQNIEVGSSETKIPVSLPAFAELSISDDFVVGDEPLVKMRSYGDALKTGDKVKYFMETEGLGIDRQDILGQAFEAVYFTLPNLKSGEYKVRSGITAGSYKDVVIKTVKVVDTRLEETVSNKYILNDNPKIAGGRTGITSLVFTDKNRGQYYYDVSELLWTSGKRVDQQLSGVAGYDLMKKYFTEPDQMSGEFISVNYQDSSGGIRLLSYDSPNLELSAKVSAVGKEYFSQANLSGYFYEYLNRKDVNKDEVCMALYGLANLNEPVLLLVRDFSKRNDLAVKDRLYIGLAAMALGDKKLANDIYTKILNETGEEYAPYKRLKVSSDKDEIVEATALGAVLGAELADKNANALWLYAVKNQPKDLLINLEKISYLSAVIPQLPSGPSKFYFVRDGIKEEKSLERGESFRLPVLSEDLPQMTFGVFEGNVAVMSRYYRPVSEVKNTTDLMSVEKKYFNEADQESTTFKEGEIVKIQIHYKLEDRAYDGDYEITDILPSGLKFVAGSLKTQNEDYCFHRFPEEIFGQKIRFYASKGDNRCEQKTDDITFYYYARIANLGKFKVEPVIMQTVASNDFKIFSNFSEIILEKR